ncbi:MAG TPA: hypothetical protein VHT91_03775 [Kofleriaceae bacterium]|nr:hypothetical protein [Kofleriaceae bacterium]
MSIRVSTSRTSCRLTGRIRLIDLPSLLPSRWAAQRAAAATAAAAAQP